MARRALDVRGIPLWLLHDYLVEAGGRPGSAGRIVGEGWTARLRELEDYRIGNLSVGQVLVELDGTEQAIASVEACLAPKLLRGGG